MRALILSHLRLYPADNGARMRLFNLLRHCAREHDLAVIAPETQAPAALRVALGPTARVITLPWDTTSRTRRLGGLLAPFPRDVYRPDSPLTQAVAAEVQHWQPDLILATDPILGEFLRPFRSATRVVDIAADHGLYIWRVMRSKPLAARPRWWLRWLKWAHYTRSLGHTVDQWIVTASMDQAALCKQLPTQARVAVVPNGVDLAANPYRPNPAAPLRIAHCGALSYEPNRDGLQQFCREVWPQLRRQVPGVELLVTGDSSAAPPELRTAPGVILTGYVPDVQAVLHAVRAVVVPLRLGVGTRLKILEAMACGTPVVATSVGAEGLAVTDEHDLLVADTPSAFATQVARLLRTPALRARIADAARQTVEARYGWDIIGRHFCATLCQAALPAAGGAVSLHSSGGSHG